MGLANLTLSATYLIQNVFPCTHLLNCCHLCSSITFLSAFFRISSCLFSLYLITHALQIPILRISYAKLWEHFSILKLLNWPKNSILGYFIQQTVPRVFILCFSARIWGFFRLVPDWTIFILCSTDRTSWFSRQGLRFRVFQIWTSKRIWEFWRLVPCWTVLIFYSDKRTSGSNPWLVRLSLSRDCSLTLYNKISQRCYTRLLFSI